MFITFYLCKLLPKKTFSYVIEYIVSKNCIAKVSTDTEKFFHRTDDSPIISTFLDIKHSIVRPTLDDRTLPKEKMAPKQARDKTTSNKKSSFNCFRILHIGTLAVALLSMIIALFLIGSAVHRDIVKMTVTISPDGFTALVRELESVIEDTSNTASNTARRELRDTREELRKVQNELNEVKRQLNKVKGDVIKQPFGNSWPGRKRRELPVSRSSTSFDVPVRPLTIAKLDSLNDIPILGTIIKVFANIVLNLATFPLFALIMVTILACTLYLCKITGRLLYYLIFTNESVQKTKGAQCLSILLNIRSIMHEFMWTIAVASIVLVLLFIYVKALPYLSGGNWTNCWLGLMTIDFKRGPGVTQIQIACLFALVSIALNVIDQIVYAICALICPGKSVVVNEQDKEEQTAWISKKT
jgi:hypothetical protein